MTIVDMPMEYCLRLSRIVKNNNAKAVLTWPY